MEKIRALPAILFPHSCLPESFMDKILSLFGAITVCQPWFMEAPLPNTETRDLSSVHIVRPPENLKPKDDFRRLLSEYKLWMDQNRDTGYAAAMAVTRDETDFEDTPWEIRQMILGKGQDTPVSQENHALKWHLILHLTRELEENSLAAEKMLGQVKQQESPLAEALGELAPPQKGMLHDLPDSGSPSLLEAHQFRPLFEAWFGLFGKYIDDHALLVTFDPNVMEYATDIFEEAGVPLNNEAESPFSLEPFSGETSITARPFPQLSDDMRKQKDPVLAGLSRRTMVLLGSD